MGVVCQEKSSTRYGSVLLIRSSASTIPSLGKSVEAIAEEAFALKKEENTQRLRFRLRIGVRASDRFPPAVPFCKEKALVIKGPFL